MIGCAVSRIYSSIHRHVQRPLLTNRTLHIQTMYNNYILAINDDNTECSTTLEDLLQYKQRASKIQKAYNYLLYIFMFENPFKTIKR